MAATKLKLVIRQGETFQRVIRWEVKPIVYKPITAITQAAPAVATVLSHGLASGWRAAILSVLGMTEINTLNTPPRDSDFHQVTVVDPNTVSFNDINSAGYTAYASGGYLMYYTPQSIAGYSARLTIKDRIGGTVLATCTSGSPDNRIALDNTNHTITINISAVDTAAFTFTTGVYDLELVSGAGVVTTLYSGGVSVVKEVTT